MSARILAAILVSILGCAPARAADTFDDGIFEGECVAPVAGWFVPLGVFRESYAAPIEKVVAASRPMTASELAAYASGGDELVVTRDYLLFAYPNQGSNAFLWTGERDAAARPVHLRTWNGEFWDSHSRGHSSERGDAAEIAFRATPPDAAVVHVLVDPQLGRPFRTERVRFARFPGRSAIIDAGLARADAVAWISPWSSPPRWPRRLDCVKGDVDVASLRSLPGAEKLRNSTLVFLSGSGPSRRIEFSYDAESGVFAGDFGPVADPDFDDIPLEERRHFRWRLARRVAGAGLSEPATLSVVEPGDGWIAIELAIGSGAPGELYGVPILRHQRDGGEPLFRFEFRHGESRGEIATRGRFGVDSFDAAGPEPFDPLDLDYRFVRCGPGVVKLEIRPRSRPWRGEVRAIVSPWRFDRRETDERVVTSSLTLVAD